MSLQQDCQTQINDLLCTCKYLLGMSALKNVI